MSRSIDLPVSKDREYNECILFNGEKQMKNSGFSISPSCSNCKRSEILGHNYFCRKRREQYKIYDFEKKFAQIGI